MRRRRSVRPLKPVGVEWAVAGAITLPAGALFISAAALFSRHPDVGGGLAAAVGTGLASIVGWWYVRRAARAGCVPPSDATTMSPTRRKGS